MSRPWLRDSWSSQTYVLLAISTTRGIQAESDRERLRLVGRRRPERRSLGPAARASAAIAATTEPQVERALLLGEDADGEIETPDERVEAVPEEDPPGRLDEAQLAGQRGGCLAGRQAHELEQREAVRRRAGGPPAKAASRRWIASR